MVGVPGTASTIFSAVRDANVNVIMISQASSEHSVCFAVKQIDAERTTFCLRQRYAKPAVTYSLSSNQVLKGPPPCIRVDYGHARTHWPRQMWAQHLTLAQAQNKMRMYIFHFLIPKKKTF